MSLKKITVDYDWKADVTFIIDDNKFTEEVAKDINSFWSGADYRLDNEGNAFDGVIKMLSGILLSMATDRGLSVHGLIHEFDWGKCNGVEGWPNLDGSYGIKLHAIDQFEFNADDMTIKTTDYTEAK